MDDALLQRAGQLAALSGHGRAFALRLRRCPERADPLERYAQLPAGRRRLLTHDGQWLLVEGHAGLWHSTGADRFHRASRLYAALQHRLVIDAPADAPRPPLCWLEGGFAADGGADGLWGGVTAGCRLILPRRAWWQQGGSCWQQEVLAVSASGHIAAEAETTPRLATWPALMLPDYRELVRDALVLLRGGALRKVVLARAEDRQHEALSTNEIVSRLQKGARGQWLYAVDLDSERCFLGRSPELLLASRGQEWQSMALAGTRARAADPTQDRNLAADLLSSTKERKEHQLVVEHLVRALADATGGIRVSDRPVLRRLPHLQHLETRIDLHQPNGDCYQALAALHPTPAVAGLPMPLAAEWLLHHEGLDRGLYTGVIGWRTPDASEHIVPLRGAVVDGERARLFAGAGLVETSDPDAEWAETELKLQGMRQILTR